MSPELPPRHDLGTICELLKEKHNVELLGRHDRQSLIIRYGHYAPGDGYPRAYRGARCLDLVKAYAEGLSTGYESLTQIFPQKLGSEISLPVTLVFHLPDSRIGARQVPFVAPAGSLGFVIALSNYSPETTPEARYARARCEAAHELCHIFQFHANPRGSSRNWLFEATAVWFAAKTYPKAPESLHFHQEWLYSPEISLHAGTGRTAAMFVHWLARRFGESILRRIWSDFPLGGIVAIERASGSEIAHLFHEYARDAWFVSDPGSNCFLPLLEDTWGLREARYELDRLSTAVHLSGSIDPLAANYIMMRPPTSTLIECSLSETPQQAQQPSLTAEIAQRRNDKTRGHRIQFQPSSFSNGASISNASMTLAAADDSDHLVITVPTDPKATTRITTFLAEPRLSPRSPEAIPNTTYMRMRQMVPCTFWPKKTPPRVTTK